MDAASSDSYERRVARGTVVNAGGALVGQAAEVATVALLVNRLGLVAFGVIVLAQGWSQLSFVLESGLGQQVVRRIAAHEQSVPDLTPAVLLYASLGVAVGVVSVSLSPLAVNTVLDLGGEAQRAVEAFALVSVGGAIRLASGFVPRALVGAVRLPALRVCGLIRTVGMLVGTYLLVDPGPDGLVVAARAFVVAELLAALVGLLLVVPRTMTVGRSSVSREELKELVRGAKAMTASGGIGLFGNRVDSIVVAVALGSSATATYGVALRAYDLVRSATELLSLALMPATARALALETRRHIGELYESAWRLIVAIVWPIAVTVIIFAPVVLAAWIDRPLPDGSSALVAAMVLALAIGPGGLAFYVITGADRVRDVLAIQTVAVLANLAVEIVLVNAIGVAAVFIGSTVATVLVARRYLRIVAELSGTPAGQLMWAARRPVLCVAVLGAAVAGLRAANTTDPALVAGLAVVFAAYAIATIVWAIPRGELMLLVNR